MAGSKGYLYLLQKEVIMKRGVLTFCLIVVVSSAVFCQVDTSQAVDTSKSIDRAAYVFGGISYPYLPAEFKNYWKKGWNAGVGYGLSFAPGSIGYVEVFGTVEYSRWAFDSVAYRNALESQYSNPNLQINAGKLVGNSAASIIAAMLNLKGSFSSTKHTVAPYFLLGIGYMHLSADSSSIVTIVRNDTTAYTIASRKEGSFAWTAGVGIEIPIFDAATFFLQARSILGSSDPTRQYFPISGGFRIIL